MDPISALLIRHWSHATARSALPDAPVVREERMRLRALPFKRSRR
jgi:hypothetical protein